MQRDEFYSLIVTYTFHDDDKRNAFRNALKEVHKKLVELDESTYGIIRGDSTEEKGHLDSIYTKIGATSNDSVDLFCSGSHAFCEDEKKRIKRIKITGKH